MDWLFGEPTLDDLLSDPVIVAAMARDGTDAAALRSMLHDVDRARSAGSAPSRPRQPATEHHAA
jgi:hypothetical protein